MDAAFRAGDGLGEREEQCEVAMDAFLFQHLGGLDALPRARDFNEHAVAADARLFVNRDELARLRDGAVLVKRQPRIRLGAHAAGHDLEDFEAEIDEDVVHHVVHLLRAGKPAVFAIGHGLLHEVRVLGLRGGCQNQRRIRRRILRLVSLHGFEIARIGDDFGELLELIELRGHMSNF